MGTIPSKNAPADKQTSQWAEKAKQLAAQSQTTTSPTNNPPDNPPDTTDSQNKARNEMTAAIAGIQNNENPAHTPEVKVDDEADADNSGAEHQIRTLSRGAVEELKLRKRIVTQLKQKRRIQEDPHQRWNAASQEHLSLQIKQYNDIKNPEAQLLNCAAFKTKAGSTQDEFRESLVAVRLGVGSISQIRIMGVNENTPIPAPTPAPAPTSSTALQTSSTAPSIKRCSERDVDVILGAHFQSGTHNHEYSKSAVNLVANSGSFTLNEETGMLLEGVMQWVETIVGELQEQGVLNDAPVVKLLEKNMELFDSKSRGKFAATKNENGVGGRVWVSQEIQEQSKKINLHARMVSMRLLYISKLTSTGAISMDEMERWACGDEEELPQSVLDHEDYVRLHAKLYAHPIPVILFGAEARQSWHLEFGRPTSSSSSSSSSGKQSFSSFAWLALPKCMVHLWGLFPSAPFKATKGHIKDISDGFLGAFGNCQVGDQAKAIEILNNGQVISCLRMVSRRACATSYDVAGASFHEMPRNMSRRYIPISFIIKHLLTSFGPIRGWVIVEIMHRMNQDQCFGDELKKTLTKADFVIKIRKCVQNKNKRLETHHGAVGSHTWKVTLPLEQRIPPFSNTRAGIWDAIFHFTRNSLNNSDVPPYYCQEEEKFKKELQTMKQKKDVWQRDGRARKLGRKFSMKNNVYTVKHKFETALANIPWGSEVGQEVFGDNEECWSEPAETGTSLGNQLWRCETAYTAATDTAAETLAVWCPISTTRMGYRRSYLHWERAIAMYNHNMIQDSELDRQ